MEIGFIGAGKAGKALGLYFKSHGLTVSGYYSKTAQSAREAAALTASAAFGTVEEAAGPAGVVFIAVPDHALEELDAEAAALLRAGRIGGGKVWLHLSGAHPSDCLAGIKAAGGAVGSMHPLLSFGTPEDSAGRLNGAWFTLEGTDEAVRAARAILDETGGRYSLMEAGGKAVYHAGACVVSNFLVTLLESGARFFEAAGMDRQDVFRAIGPLVDATLANIREKGPVEALTGPIVRGDYNTVGVHLKAIEARLPSELDFYKALALKTAEILEGSRLTGAQTEKFRQILEETAHV
ncbi:Predicted oxidoreductase, contains short-chain dehydrogenase (SDR) and DUF2520 domains [Sporobacter termitidis DSM 10068]|uniref:Predicted oxidoreductase, contains short-chain dehydrogenase (SDR) and DUF2520 domains n=1 Tax=Sporobacter termitidis DSM 10068 TaxID=1123282 RepID=A0A1M5XSQ7_9FIRM|nr:Rossmann-like and DUF2520 domain-containing protein [Sporobacter termitidis]SHI02732.1 Predicted oxidoreductase, contains short-chain dehydrogenase (SDR) and DUF2520 domains [Sporobacter termitidis DSM 10068]